MTATLSRRRYLRLRVEGLAIWRVAGQPESPRQESKVRDLSLRGISFIAEESLEVETPLDFELHLEGSARPHLKGEAVVVWSGRREEDAEGVLVKAQFSAVNPSEVLALLLEAYPSNPEVHGSLCAEVRFCSDTEKGHCPAYRQGKNCWEFQEMECCSAPRKECCNCPYAALAFLT